MRIFSGRKNKTSSFRKGSRFRSNYFQERIRSARSFQRHPKILPEARTNVSLAVFSRKSRILWSLAGILFILGLIYVLFSPTFKVREFTVTDVSTLPENTVEEWLLELANKRVYYFLSGNHILAITRGGIEKLLAAKTVYFKKITSLEKHWPNSVIVKLEERQPALIWKNKEKSFLIDNEGFVLEQVPTGFVEATTTRQAYLYVSEQNDDKIETGTFYKQSIVVFLNELRNRWNKLVEYPIASASVPEKSESEVYVTTDLGFSVYLDAKSDISHELEVLSRILRQVINFNRVEDLAYIDVRLPAVAYYCFRGEPCGSVETESKEKTDANPKIP